MKNIRMRAVNPGTKAPVGKLAGKKVMLVEDDIFLSDIIARNLSAEKCAFVHSDNAPQALSLAEAERPDVIILDILLPGMNGFEMLKQLKSNEKLKRIPVILLSNLSQKKDVEKGLRLGAARFLVKASMNLDEVVAQLEEVLTQAQG